MAEGPESAFDSAVLELLGGVVETLQEWVRADAKRPAYQIPDSHYVLAARISELVELLAALRELAEDIRGA